MMSMLMCLGCVLLDLMTVHSEYCVFFSFEEQNTYIVSFKCWTCCSLTVLNKCSGGEVLHLLKGGLLLCEIYVFIFLLTAR